MDPAPIVAIAMLLDQAGPAQLAEVVGDEVLGKTQFVGELTVADLASHDQLEDPPSSLIRHQLEERRCGGLDIGERARYPNSGHVHIPERPGGVDCRNECDASTEITSTFIDVMVSPHREELSVPKVPNLSGGEPGIRTGRIDAEAGADER